METDKILCDIQNSIAEWHSAAINGQNVDENFLDKYVNESSQVTSINDLVKLLTIANTEVWHLMDKFADDNCKIAADAAKRSVVFNKARNNIIELIDESIMRQVEK